MVKRDFAGIIEERRSSTSKCSIFFWTREAVPKGIAFDQVILMCRDKSTRGPNFNWNFLSIWYWKAVCHCGQNVLYPSSSSLLALSMETSFFSWVFSNNRLFSNRLHKEFQARTKFSSHSRNCLTIVLASRRVLSHK